MRPARCCDWIGRRQARAALALTALLASCQPLPHPFADDRPPAELLAVPDSAGVSIAPVEGQPNDVAAKLGAATAHALLGHDIPASDRTVGRDSYQLYGHLTQSRRGGKSAVAVQWRLTDAKGREVGERGVGIEATAEDWRSAGTAMVERLAALSADAVAPLLVKQPAAPRLAALAGPTAGRAEPDVLPAGPSPPAKPSDPEPPANKPAVPAIASTQPSAASAKPPGQTSPAPAKPATTRESRRIRVLVRRVTGAPGDGGTSLVRAVTGVLRQQDLTIVDPGGKADFTIDGEVSLVPIGPDKQHVKIVWHVRNASGAELGNVGQENDVPSGLLSGAWGDIASVVALGAGDGILQVLARAVPPANPSAPTTAVAAPGGSKPEASKPEASKTGPEKTPRSNTPPPAAKSAKKGNS